jgi:predicted O-methyltransferase YrrM
MSLYAAMLGETGRPLGWLLEGMITAQVTSVLARLGVADELADGPLTTAQLALRVGFAQAGFRPLASGRIIDVGGSRGTLLAYLLGALPTAHGVLMDRAEALAEAPGFLAEAGVADRVELVVGDFLREVPAGGDLYVLSQILHNWDDEHVRTIAGNCHRASRPGGGLMVIDYVLPDGPEPSLAHLMDLIMMMLLGGRERTRAEHEALLGPEGYTLIRDTPLTEVLPWRVLEFERS